MLPALHRVNFVRPCFFRYFGTCQPAGGREIPSNLKLSAFDLSTMCRGVQYRVII